MLCPPSTPPGGSQLTEIFRENGNWPTLRSEVRPAFERRPWIYMEDRPAKIKDYFRSRAFLPSLRVACQKARGARTAQDPSIGGSMPISERIFPAIINILTLTISQSSKRYRYFARSYSKVPWGKAPMLSNGSGRALSTIGPSGQSLTLEDLPQSDTVRWVIRRKAELVAAIRGRLLSLEDACERYQLSEEELESWAKSLDHYGLRGLRSTKLQFYRKSDADKNRVYSHRDG